MVKNAEVNLADSPPQANAVHTLSAALAQRHQVLPLRVVGQTLYLAMSDPANVVAIDEVKLATGYDIYPLGADSGQLAAEIANHYGALDSIARYPADENNGPGLEALPCLTVSDTTTVSTTNIINSLFDQAVQIGRASCRERV